jgi:HK97 family phage portal protein
MALQLISLGKASQPLRNTVYSGTQFDDQERYIAANLYQRIRHTPELVAMLDTVVTDHFMGNIDFFDANDKPLGPTKLKQINKFWKDSNVQGEAFYGQALDFFVDGSSFGWHISANGILTAKQKEAIAKLKALNYQVGQYAEESSNMPRKISYLPASTVTIKHDEFGEVFYVQEAAGKKVRWEKDQVVHIKLMDFNGEIRGFSPLKSLVKEVVMMYMLKENIVAKMRNGGSPDYIISLKGNQQVSKARFERLRTALESFSHLHKSHGNMPIDAEVTVQPLGTDLKDMEYRELAMFIISEFALSLGLPSSRVPFMMTGSGGTSNKGELSGNSEDAYQRKINARRMLWENGWNKVFRKAGFSFQFRRDNLQDDVRETQASTQRVAYVSEVQNSLLKSGKKLTLPAHLALLSGSKINLTEDDIEDISDEERMNAMPFNSPIAGQGGKMQPSNMDSKSKVSQDKSVAKEKTAFNNNKQ